MKLKRLAVAVNLALGSFMEKYGFAPGVLAVMLDKAEHGKLAKEVQALYVEKDGKYVLDLPENYEDVTQAKGALQKEREARKEEARLRKELEKKFEGIDPEEVRKILEKLGSDEERALMK